VPELQRLAPWDEVRYFDAPIATAPAVEHDVQTVIAPANPRRVALYISASIATGNVLWVFPTVGGSGAVGLILQPIQPVLLLTVGDIGPIVGYEWSAFTSAAGSIQCGVLDISLRDWPSDGPQNGGVPSSAADSTPTLPPQPLAGSSSPQVRIVSALPSLLARLAQRGFRPNQ
jgi:hypothetical protein